MGVILLISLTQHLEHSIRMILGHLIWDFGGDCSKAVCVWGELDLIWKLELQFVESQKHAVVSGVWWS